MKSRLLILYPSSYNLANKIIYLKILKDLFIKKKNFIRGLITSTINYNLEAINIHH